MGVMMFDLHLPTPFALMHVPYVFPAHSTLSNFSGVSSALPKPRPYTSMAPEGTKPRAIYWFRTDLHLHD